MGIRPSKETDPCRSVDGCILRIQPIGVKFPLLAIILIVWQSSWQNGASAFDVDGRTRMQWQEITTKICPDISYKSCKDVSRKSWTKAARTTVLAERFMGLGACQYPVIQECGMHHACTVTIRPSSRFSDVKCHLHGNLRPKLMRFAPCPHPHHHGAHVVMYKRVPMWMAWGRL